MSLRLATVPEKRVSPNRSMEWATGTRDGTSLFPTNPLLFQQRSKRTLCFILC